MARYSNTGASTAVADSAVVVWTMIGHAGGGILNLEVANTGGKALTALAIELQDAPNGEWYSYIATTDWAAPTDNRFIRVSPAAPNTLAGAAKAHLVINVNAAYGVRVKAIAGAAGNATTVVACGSLVDAVAINNNVDVDSITITGSGLSTAANQETEIAALQAGNGNGLTFSRVAITQAEAGAVEVIAAAAGKVNRLHALVLTADAAGTVTIKRAATALTGAMPVAANGGLVIPFTADARGCLATAANEALNVVSATAKVFGYAVVSQQ